jgi:hypothetical protein
MDWIHLELLGCLSTIRYPKHKSNTTFRKLDLFLEYRMMDKVQNPSTSERYTPLSEVFRIYLQKLELTIAASRETVAAFVEYFILLNTFGAL